MRELSVQSLTEFKDEIELLTSDTRLGLKECEELLEQVKEMQLAVRECEKQFRDSECSKMELLLVYAECLLEIRITGILEALWNSKNVV